MTQSPEQELREKIKEILGTAQDGYLTKSTEINSPEAWITYTTEYKYQLLTDPILSLISSEKQEAVESFSNKVKRSFNEEYRKDGSAFDLMNITIVERLDKILADYSGKESNEGNQIQSVECTRKKDV